MCEINVKELLLPLQIKGGTNRAPPKGIVGSEALPKEIVGSEAPPKEMVGSEAPPKGIVGSEMDSAEDLVLGIGSGVFTL